MPESNYLTVSWSISRGRDTYGYNICRLDDANTDKRYRCHGGGYDMIGTVLGEWAQDTLQDRLLKLQDRAYSRVDLDTMERTYNEGEHLYGMTVLVENGVPRVSLDGACGQSSIERVLSAAGVTLRRTWNRKGNTTGWIVEYDA